MTSDQKYEGRNNSAQNSSATVNFDPQTVERSPLASQPYFQWEASYLTKLANDPHKSEWIFGVLNTVRDINESTDPTGGLCLLLAEFLASQPHGIATHISELRAVTKLIVQLNELNTNYRCLNDATGYNDQEIEASEHQAAYLKRKGVSGNE